MSKPFRLLVPQMNPNDEHAVLVCWHVAAGSHVRAGQPVATLETTKSTFDVEAPREGFVFFTATANSLIPVGARLAWICDENIAPTGEDAAGAEQDPARTAGSRFTRKALQLMSRHGLTSEDFDAAAERIEAADVMEAVRRRTSSSPGPAPAHPDCEPLEQSPSKILEVRALGEAHQSAIHSSVALSVSCEKIDARLRAFAQQGGPLSLLEVVIHDTARLLSDFAELNGYYAAGKAWRYKTVAIGFAINLGKSLRVPVVHRAAELSQVEIVRAVRGLSLQYMREELKMADLSGGTFTVTDLSSHGVEHFVPVLNERQSAILGICAERVGSGRRDIVLAFDHRMADGMQAATFLARLRERLEQGPTVIERAV